MPVDSHHPDYDKYHFQWKKCRDCVQGEEAVKGEGQLYLPQLEGTTDYEYEPYKDRALFYSASDRTVKALVGAIMRKPPDLAFPPDEELLSDVGARGEPIELIIKSLVEEVITTGRAGVLIDADTEGDPEADPYLVIYFAENIINWGEVNIKGRQTLQFVVMLEDSPQREDGDFAYSVKERYRVLELENPGMPDQRYHVTVWEKQTEEDNGSEANKEQNKDKFVKISDVYPTFRGGRPIPYIPFLFFSPNNVTPSVDRSPIIDLVNVNLSHFRNSADLEHGLHFTALPTAWVAGFDPATTKLHIGSSSAWVSENVNAHAGFLEFTGAGLKTISEAMDKKEKQMAVLGSRMLEEQKADSEAAAAIRLRHSGEQSVLQSLVTAADEGLTMVFGWLAEWIGSPNAKCNAKLNNEFNPLGIDPPTLLVLMQAVQAGHLSWNTLFWNAQRGNLIPDGVDSDGEKALIEAGVPLPPAGEIPEETALEGGSSPVKAKMGSVGGGGEGADV